MPQAGVVLTKIPRRTHTALQAHTPGYAGLYFAQGEKGTL